MYSFGPMSADFRKPLGIFTRAASKATKLQKPEIQVMCVD
jgi:hypothetical protein